MLKSEPRSGVALVALRLWVPFPEWRQHPGQVVDLAAAASSGPTPRAPLPGMCVP
jgi:hypothetical protein